MKLPFGVHVALYATFLKGSYPEMQKNRVNIREVRQIETNWFSVLLFHHFSLM
jgi:hypothetical protein